ncbi:hypothetical protein FI667_g9472, partial [Globisporangium splendens]
MAKHATTSSSGPKQGSAATRAAHVSSGPNQKSARVQTASEPSISASKSVGSSATNHSDHSSTAAKDANASKGVIRRVRWDEVAFEGDDQGPWSHRLHASVSEQVSAAYMGEGLAV